MLEISISLLYYYTTGYDIYQTWLLYRFNLYNSDFWPFLIKIPIFWSRYTPKICINSDFLAIFDQNSDFLACLEPGLPEYYYILYYTIFTIFILYFGHTIFFFEKYTILYYIFDPYTIFFSGSKYISLHNVYINNSYLCDICQCILSKFLPAAQFIIIKISTHFDANEN